MSSSGIIEVLVPTYNGEAFVAHALRSALSQTITDIRVIVSDDASTDGTLDVCATVAESDDRVEIRATTRNRGWVGNANSLLDSVESDLFLVLSQDDTLEPTALERLSEALEARPDAVVAASDIASFGERSAVIGFEPAGTRTAERLLTFLGGWPTGVAFHGLTRRAAIDAGIRLRPTPFHSFHADTVYVAELLAAGGAARVPERLYRKRYVGWSVSSAAWGFDDDTAPHAWETHTESLINAIALIRMRRHHRRRILGACLDRLVRELRFDRHPLNPRLEVVSRLARRAANAVGGGADWASARAFLAEAIHAHHFGTIDEARRLARAAVDRDPSCSEARMTLAPALLAAGRTDEGIAEVRRAVADQPWNPSVRLSACLVFEAAMLLDDAMAEARAAIVIEPTAAAPWLFLSRIQEHRGDLPAARNSARRAVDLDPGDTAAIERLRWS